MDIYAQNATPNGTITININQQNGRAIQITTSPHNTVSVLKNQIEAHTGINARHQMLIYNSSTLLDNVTLNSYSIFNGSTLLMLIQINNFQQQPAFPVNEQIEVKFEAGVIRMLINNRTTFTTLKREICDKMTFLCQGRLFQTKSQLKTKLVNIPGISNSTIIAKLPRFKPLPQNHSPGQMSGNFGSNNGPINIYAGAGQNQPQTQPTLPQFPPNPSMTVQPPNIKTNTLVISSNKVTSVKPFFPGMAVEEQPPANTNYPVPPIENVYVTIKKDTENLSLGISRNKSVGELQKAVEGLTSIPAEQQVLSLDSKILQEPTKTLKDCGVLNGSVIELFTSLDAVSANQGAMTQAGESEDPNQPPESAKKLVMVVLEEESGFKTNYFCKPATETALGLISKWKKARLQGKSPTNKKPVLELEGVELSPESSPIWKFGVEANSVLKIKLKETNFVQSTMMVTEGFSKLGDTNVVQGMVDESEIKLKVKTVAGKYCHVSIDAQKKVSDLKKIVENQLNVDKANQRLIAGSKLLRDKQTLNECGLIDGSEVHLIIKTKII